MPVVQNLPFIVRRERSTVMPMMHVVSHCTKVSTARKKEMHHEAFMGITEAANASSGVLNSLNQLK